MTKPLCIALQLVGALILLIGVGAFAEDGISFALIFGLSLLVVGGIGTRLNINKRR